MFNTKNTFNKMMGLCLLASLGFVALLSLVPTGAVSAATKPSLGAAESFSVLAWLSMSAANPTTVSGDLGLASGLAASKTGTWIVVGGSEYFGPSSLAATANANALSAYNNLAGQGPPDGTFPVTSFAPGPGVYNAASDITFTGTITLSGNATDVWVFQVGRDLSFAGSSRVLLTGAAQACNVYWAIARDAVISSGAAFVGTVIAHRDITVVTGATVNGRLISLDSSLTTDGQNIAETCAAAPAPAILTLAKSVNGGSALPAAWTLSATGPTTISGANSSAAVTNAAVSAGSYALSESGGPSGYVASTYSCVKNGGAPVVSNTISLAAGDTATCTINNNDLNNDLPTSVPTLNEWGMIIFMGLAGLGSVYYLRRLRARA